MYFLWFLLEDNSARLDDDPECTWSSQYKSAQSSGKKAKLSRSISILSATQKYKLTVVGTPALEERCPSVSPRCPKVDPQA
ncbi:hypothetical protein EG68_00976 [Paragonimus skrjabini miyazakii]|uniref:Uncharacterized protein n=1 Tax=Paragonimus skrjabini miyazakii TaxID=59628 RepID=A0A8S9Z8C8_9TREM|nr:hypothetical protein EG68_00976 [Paragonimus skrjabini miyazakii]